MFQTQTPSASKHFDEAQLTNHEPQVLGTISRQLLNKNTVESLLLKSIFQRLLTQQKEAQPLMQHRALGSAPFGGNDEAHQSKSLGRHGQRGSLTWLKTAWPREPERVAAELFSKAGGLIHTWKT